jgi:RNA polymerase sigma factor (sigma-70 family)
MPELIYFFPPDCDCVGIFERIYHEWNRTLFVHVRKKADFDLAREVCQQVWTEIWQAVKAGTYTYLAPGLLVYRADSRIKDHYRRAARFPQFDPALHDVSDRLNMDERIDHKTALAALPDDESNIFTLFFREGFTQEEIAERLSISTRTVRRKLDAALTHLQEFLQSTMAAPKSSER